MILEKIVKEIEVLQTVGPVDVDIASLTLDSRSAEPGSLFFAIRGTGIDGHEFIDAAIERGAAAVMCEELPTNPDPRVTYVVVADSHRAMGEAAAAFHDHPSRKLKLIGVTGTNGKTTTATLLCDAMRALGHGAGLISTVDYRIGDTVLPSTHTTPDPLRLNAMLATMVERGCDCCFMEVSSHAIVQQRIAGLWFMGAAFSNITHEHLDYHGTFAAYIAAKKSFFDGLPKTAFAITNVDDRNGRVMVQNTKAKVRTVSLRAPADYRCKIVEQHFDGMLLAIDGTELWVCFTGRFNAYNLVTVYAALREMGIDKEDALRVISTLKPVSGRFETVRSAKGITAIVDYAHTPDALQNALDAIAEIRRQGQKIYTVVGCGGDRDTTKRPEMARIAAECSDFAILTSDNPRTEDPAEILAQMKAGLVAGHRAVGIIDRREAIGTAVAMAAAGDIILIAGKGHETYQIVGTETRHFDDREEVRKAFLNFDL
ncbi:MAG: UDP-N-acetylmuramoyl-L-alanyl-D-glutamate--2,6-diaminopimelate ligase [Alistipes sp.]|jgi:UDP-N-acetylmuramoyl-L-alanyl-D-glutamate--2,6-diaminopimelate ligase|nr:UDP-N-acetylmuramoyl-L-alanyl-D-glutamate--2,6-diaminopimelate ligase [Alistipes sp.]